MLNHNSRVLITGGSGLLGMAVQKKLRENNIDFIAPPRKELDLLEYGLTLEYLKNYEPTEVVHLAAVVFGLGGNLRNQMNSAVFNTTMNNNLFSALYQIPPKNIFFAGTAASYSYPFKALPLEENVFFEGFPHYGEFGYAMAKKHAYTYLKILKEEKKTSFIYGVFTNLFGEHDNFDIDNGHVIPSLIAKACIAKKENRALEVWGDGSARRDFLYSEEAAKAIFFLLNTSLTEEVINISSGESYSMKEVAELIAQYANIKQEIVYLKDMPSGIRDREISNKKIVDLGWCLDSDFKKSLCKTYAWYSEQERC